MNETDTAGMKAQIADASTPLVIDLHAEWCGFCTRMQPHIDRLAAEREGSIRFYGSDVDDNEELYTLLGVKTLPCVVLYKDGVEVARRGSGDYDQLSAWLAENGL
jgi:thioredoxin-like negative regulator of GroEL